MLLPEKQVGGIYQAKVGIVYRAFDAASNTVGVKLSLANQNLKLRAGIHCKVRFADIP